MWVSQAPAPVGSPRSSPDRHSLSHKQASSRCIFRAESPSRSGYAHKRRGGIKHGVVRHRHTDCWAVHWPASAGAWLHAVRACPCAARASPSCRQAACSGCASSSACTQANASTSAALEVSVRGTGDKVGYQQVGPACARSGPTAERPASATIRSPAQHPVGRWDALLQSVARAAVSCVGSQQLLWCQRNDRIPRERTHSCQLAQTLESAACIPLQCRMCRS